MRREGRLLAPAILLTGRQTAGRGRGANLWHAPRGVITASFVLNAHDTLPPQHVPLIAGLATRSAIESMGVEGIGIKWPNDLWHADRKIAGLLCERFGAIDVIGIGVNVNVELASLPRDVAKSSSSLHLVAGGMLNQTSLLVMIAHALRLALADSRASLAAVRDSWKRYDAIEGRRVLVTRDDEPAISGVAAGIDSSGRLLIRSGPTTHAVLNGTVRLA